MKMLVHAGPDVNAQDGRYGNALQAASILGHQQIVRILVDAGKDLTAKGCKDLMKIPVPERMSSISKQ